MIRISRTNSNYEREPLTSPFGFKGGYLSEAWQSVALMESANGHRGLGLATQSTLWSDAAVFQENSQAAGNCLMFLLTAHALRASCEIAFETPLDLLDALLPMTFEFGKRITGRRDLRLTFALNSLVAVDNAAWQVYCQERGVTSFDAMVPEEFKSPLSCRHERLACIPLITYGVPPAGIAAALEAGHFFLKIKVGSDPDGDGDPEKMLRWDMERLSAIHAIAKDRTTPYTDGQIIPYYLDANGRYDGKERLMRLLDHAQKIGALERIALFEEPFPESYEADVSDLPVRIAADESAHSDKEALERIQMGYSAVALKPIAKTLSMSLKIAKLAAEKGVPCFCADLTVNPVLLSWNMNVAARLAPLPGMKVGVLESNGGQNYANWEKMKSYHPRHGAPWVDSVRGFFNLDRDFYSSSGGILMPSQHYLDLVR